MTLQWKQEENILQFCEFQIGSWFKDWYIYIYISKWGPNKLIKNYLEYEPKPIWFLISQNTFADLKGPKMKYKLHYGWCMGRRFTAATLHNTSCSEGK